MLSCHRAEEKMGNKDHYLVAKGRLKTLLDSFVQVAGNNHPVYEVFIDKITPHESTLVLHSGNNSLTGEENKFKGQFPANKTRAGGVTFYIYSGVERYFDNPDDIRRDSSKYMEKSAPDQLPYALWAVKDSFGIYKVIISEAAYPFMGIPIPMKNFKAPPIPTHYDK
jgi:hypothetical protein